MKKIVTMVVLYSTLVFGTDYSSYTLDDLLLQKGTIPEADRVEFQSAMQSKMESFTPQERVNIQKANGSDMAQGLKLSKQQSESKSCSGSGQMKRMGSKKSY